jgi:hypothetical protein
MVSLGLLSSKEILVLMQSPVVLIFLTLRISLTFNTDGYSITRSKLGTTRLSAILKAHLIEHLLDLFALWNELTRTRYNLKVYCYCWNV